MISADTNILFAAVVPGSANHAAAEMNEHIARAEAGAPGGAPASVFQNARRSLNASPAPNAG